jgi:hypothetical protein
MVVCGHQAQGEMEFAVTIISFLRDVSDFAARRLYRTAQGFSPGLCVA